MVTQFWKQSKSTETSSTIHPADGALERLMEGNSRFIGGTRSVESIMAHMRMPDLAKKGQKPFAIILTCSDSRSPVELIFDQGVGDLFVVRVAGNIVDPSLLASIEFAVANFQSPLIFVLGHSLCGAIKATVQHCENPASSLPSTHLIDLVNRLKPAVAQTMGAPDSTSGHYLDRVTGTNVRNSMKTILDQSDIVRDAVQKGQLKIAGGVLDLHTGQVTVLETQNSSI